MTRLNFVLEVQDPGSQARATTFTTLHNQIHTPIFMPVGTQATVRSQTVEALEAAGAEMLLANTYHLLLRPGAEVFRKLGGIHRFMNWKRSVLTDSGGFQIFSLPETRSMSEEGAAFQSHVNGRRIMLTPELSIDMQKAIGSDIMMVLDQCIPSTSDHATATAAMHLTHRWAARSLAARGDSPQSLFGIVQGACFPDLRRESADCLTQLPLDGFAIGGLAVGESKEQREDFTELTAQLLPRDLPRYLMGVGRPIDLLEAVYRGVDMFDCILPNALAQQGLAFTSLGEVKLRRTVYRLADEPLDPACGCPTCRGYSRAYLHHLIKVEEYLGWQLVGAHNLHFFHALMRDMRRHILEGSFGAFYREQRELLVRSDEENPMRPTRVKRRPKRPALSLGDYELHEAAAGFYSIRHRPSGEIMHSVSAPEVEAQRLYVEQSGLGERLKGAGTQDTVTTPRPLIIWDVGLGAATNAMAAIRCYEEAERSRGLPAAGQTEALRPMHLVSFEIDLDSLKLALQHPPRFAHLKHGAPHALLKDHVWTSETGAITWTLLKGEFLERMLEAPPPELIFFDPFSSKTDAGLWTLDCFQRIRAHCGDKPAELFTYSASTAVRAALLAAGFWVGSGIGTGPKAETTRAWTPSALELTSDRSGLLGVEWLFRWERSSARWPVGLAEEEIPGFEGAVRNHPQFSRDELSAGPTSGDPAHDGKPPGNVPESDASSGEAVGRALFELGVHYQQLGLSELALTFGKRAVTELERALGPNHSRVASALASCAVYLRALNRGEEAEALAARAREIRGRGRDVLARN